MHAQRQLAVAAVRAEVRRHEVVRQALNRLRKLAERVNDPELRDRIQASLDSVRGKRRICSQLGCLEDQQGHPRACWVIHHFPISHFLVPKMELGLGGRIHLERMEKEEVSFFLFPQLCSSSQGIKIKVTAELTSAMEKWVSMRKTGRDRPMADVDPAGGVWGRKQFGTGGS